MIKSLLDELNQPPGNRGGEVEAWGRFSGKREAWGRFSCFLSVW